LIKDKKAIKLLNSEADGLEKTLSLGSMMERAYFPLFQILKKVIKRNRSKQ